MPSPHVSLVFGYFFDIASSFNIYRLSFPIHWFFRLRDFVLLLTQILTSGLAISRGEGLIHNQRSQWGVEGSHGGAFFAFTKTFGLQCFSRNGNMRTVCWGPMTWVANYLIGLYRAGRQVEEDVQLRFFWCVARAVDMGKDQVVDCNR